MRTNLFWKSKQKNMYFGLLWMHKGIQEHCWSSKVISCRSRSLAPFFLGHTSNTLLYICKKKKKVDLLSGHSAQGPTYRRFVELEEKYICGAEATLCQKSFNCIVGRQHERQAQGRGYTVQWQTTTLQFVWCSPARTVPPTGACRCAADIISKVLL